MERLKEIALQYIEFLWAAFNYDMEVFSQGWIYYWLLIPAFCYLVFFMLKWAVITAPLWVPIRMVVKGFAGFVQIITTGYAASKRKK